MQVSNRLKDSICSSNSYHINKMNKKIILEKLREQGYRITKQRLTLLDIILESQCSCCKEIFYKASKKDRNIGPATVYRMINTLEEIGAINRSNMYKIACTEECVIKNACTIKLDDNNVIELSQKKWNQIIKSGLIACGYINNENIECIIINSY